MNWYEPRGVAAFVLMCLLGATALRDGKAVLAQAAPGDVILKRTSSESPAELPLSIFPHWRHREFFTCNVCHPAIFPMKSRETAVTMDDIKQGKLCGVCHNGRIAWGVSVGTCNRCHVAQ